MAQSRLVIDGMTCSHCERAVHDALAPVSGVIEVQVDAAEGVAVIEHDGSLDMDIVAAAVGESGYAARA